MLVGKLRDRQDILRFREIVTVVAIGKYFGRCVSDPGLVHVGIDLVLRCDLAEAVGLRQVFGGVFVALVAIENAQRNIYTEAGGVIGSGAVVFALERRIRRTVGIGQLYIGVGNAHRSLGCLIVGPRRQRLLLQISQGG